MSKTELIEKLQKEIDRLDAIDFANLDMIGKSILVTRKNEISLLMADVKTINAL